MKALSKPLVRTFLLDDVDTEINPDRDMSVDIRQANQGDAERRADLYANTKQSFINGETAFTVEQRFSYPEQQRVEVFLVLAACNIPIEDPNAKDGQRDLFRFHTRPNGIPGLSMTDKEFRAAWELLPSQVADSMHAKVLLMNPNWDPKARKSSTEQ